jgi:hypothetical protein
MKGFSSNIWFFSKVVRCCMDGNRKKRESVTPGIRYCEPLNDNNGIERQLQ